MTFTNYGKDPSNYINKIKKKAKRLLQISKQSEGAIKVSNLAESLDLISKVNGFPSWHSFNTYINKENKESLVSVNSDDTKLVFQSIKNINYFMNNDGDYETLILLNYSSFVLKEAFTLLVETLGLEISLNKQSYEFIYINTPKISDKLNYDVIPYTNFSFQRKNLIKENEYKELFNVSLNHNKETVERGFFVKIKTKSSLSNALNSHSSCVGKIQDVLKFSLDKISATVVSSIALNDYKSLTITPSLKKEILSFNVDYFNNILKYIIEGNFIGKFALSFNGNFNFSAEVYDVAVKEELEKIASLPKNNSHLSQYINQLTLPVNNFAEKRYTNGVGFENIETGKVFRSDILRQYKAGSPVFIQDKLDNKKEGIGLASLLSLGYYYSLRNGEDIKTTLKSQKIVLFGDLSSSKLFSFFKDENPNVVSSIEIENDKEFSPLLIPFGFDCYPDEIRKDLIRLLNVYLFNKDSLFDDTYKIFSNILDKLNFKLKNKLGKETGISILSNFNDFTNNKFDFSLIDFIQKPFLFVFDLYSNGFIKEAEYLNYLLTPTIQDVLGVVSELNDFAYNDKEKNALKHIKECLDKKINKQNENFMKLLVSKDISVINFHCSNNLDISNYNLLFANYFGKYFLRKLIKDTGLSVSEMLSSVHKKELLSSSDKIKIENYFTSEAPLIFVDVTEKNIYRNPCGNIFRNFIGDSNSVIQIFVRSYPMYDVYGWIFTKTDLKPFLINEPLSADFIKMVDDKYSSDPRFWFIYNDKNDYCFALLHLNENLR